jgi:hypothetical protein
VCQLYYRLLGQRSTEVGHTLECLAGVLELSGDKNTALDMYKVTIASN